jgi:hypothetical protein
MSNNELLKELEEKFKIMQREMGLTSSLKQLDDIFFVSDAILHQRYVSPQLSRQICSRIVETYMGWNNYLHNLVMSAPGYMIQMNESKMLSEDDKKNALKLMAQAMVIVSGNSLVGLTKDKKEEAELIDEAVEFWNTIYRPQIEKLIRKINDGWKK